MATAKTPQEKEAARRRTNLRILQSGIKADFSFHKIPNWHTLYKRLGYDLSNLHLVENKPLTYNELKTFLERQAEELEQSINSGVKTVGDVVPKTTTEVPAIKQNEKEISIKPGSVGNEHINEQTNEQTTNNQSISTQSETIRQSIRTTVIPEDGLSQRLSEKSRQLGIDSGSASVISQQVVTPTVELAEPKVTLSAENDYGFKYSPNEAFFAYWFQKKACAELVDKIFNKKYRGVLLLAPTGVGKTFMALHIPRIAFDMNWHDERTFSHIPYLYVTKSTILQQTGRVAEKCFKMRPNVDLEIINIEQLRSKDGQYWVKREVVIEHGEEVELWKWKPNIQPCILLLDESQGTKNKKAKQSKIIHAYNNIPNNTCLVSISATPFVRVCEAQSFAVSTRRPLDHLGFPEGTLLTNDTWNAYANIIAHPGKPDDYNQAAIERLMKDLDDYIVRVRGVRPQFDAINGIRYIDFETQEERAWYLAAYDRLLEEKKKIDAAKESGDDAGICYLVILLKFAMAAELCHAKHFARDMDRVVRHGGKAAVAAPKFKQTLIKIVRLLVEEYGWSRDQISLVWGGGQTQQTDKQKAKQKIKEMSEKLKLLGMDVDEALATTGLDEVEDRVIEDLPEYLRLGPQDYEERQKEIDKFQSGKSLFCLYTLKAGGVGLSLHHTDELTSFKCRRKESGYAVEEDIPKVPVRPRETFCTVSYNAIELVQGIGRVPRLTSLSPTVQNIYCYRGTIEVKMGEVYSKKLRCLSSVVKQKEDWQDIIMSGGENHVVQQIIDKTEGIETDESSLIDEGDSEEDGENGNGNGKNKE